MTTYDECEIVSNIIAEHVLDGRTVHAVGLTKDPQGEWMVMTSVSGRWEMPAIPDALAHVPVASRSIGSDRPQAHGRYIRSVGQQIRQSFRARG